MGEREGYPIACIGIPKTVDNDLPLTDTCPGFGSVAKYVAVSIREAALDVASMCETSTKVFILEVMGRHAGWIAAAAGLAQHDRHDAPHLILFPETPFDEEDFLKKVRETVEANGYCVIAASEGTRYADGRFLAEAGTRDAFDMHSSAASPGARGNREFGLGYKYHWAVADYLQRSARHIASGVDVEQATRWRAAVESRSREECRHGCRVRTHDKPYRWRIGEASLQRVANVERRMPKAYIRKDGYGITAAARRYLEPLIAGEAYPRYVNGLPNYVSLKNELAPKKLEPWAA